MSFRKSLLVIFLSFFSLALKSQTADDVINRYIKFIGGEKNWKAVQTLTISGVYNYVGVSFPFLSYSKRPNLYKYIVTANGKSFTQAFNGKQGWRIDGFKDEKDKTILKDRQATAMANEADVELESPFIGYREKGHNVQLEGMDTAVNHGAYKIKLTRKNGNTEIYFFNNKDFSLVKKQALSTNDEMDKAPLDIEYSDYKTIGNIKVPHKISHTTNGQPVLKITIERIELNKPINNTIFNP
jgi:outer membrane lipoprotein-sorting protein